MQLSKDDLVFGLVLSTKGQPDPICEPCLAGKMTSAPFPSSTRLSTQPLELIHSDLHGPLPVRSPEGYRYWITFLDDCTKLLLKVASAGTCEAAVARVSRPQCIRQSGNKGLKSEVSN